MGVERKTERQRKKESVSKLKKKEKNCCFTSAICYNLQRWMDAGVERSEVNN